MELTRKAQVLVYRLGMETGEYPGDQGEQAIAEFVSALAANQPTDLWNDAAEGDVQAIVELRTRIGLPAIR